MAHEEVRHVKRTIWVVECETCDYKDQAVSQRTGSRLCPNCHEWLPWEKLEYTGPETKS